MQAEKARPARREKRSAPAPGLHVVTGHFDAAYNAAESTQIVFPQPASSLTRREQLIQLSATQTLACSYRVRSTESNAL